jgi:hypothetical protein
MRLSRTASMLLLSLVPACGTDIPETPPGDRVSGTIAYAGQVDPSLVRPALQIMVSVDFPPSHVPHGMLVIERPDFSGGIPYELTYLPRQDYKVSARIVDLADASLDPTQLPLGGYPDACTLLMVPDAGLVHVLGEAPVAGIDIRMYESGGLADPCWLQLLAP